jgi:radial spoke head protein 9
MEVDQIANHLKYINCNGVTLNIEERMNLNLSLHKLHNDYIFEELLFWGKINGINDRIS